MNSEFNLIMFDNPFINILWFVLNAGVIIVLGYTLYLLIKALRKYLNE